MFGATELAMQSDEHRWGRPAAPQGVRGAGTECWYGRYGMVYGMVLLYGMVHFFMVYGVVFMVYGRYGSVWYGVW